MQQQVHNISKTVLNWSSGKDASLAYYYLLEDKSYDVTRLLTTVNDEQDRVVMHGVREQLLDAQADRLPVKLKKIRLPASPSDEIYKAAMLSALGSLKEEGITTAAFGDIFLDDLKLYREQQLATAGFDAIFPLWKRDTAELLRLVDSIGIEAVIVCVDGQKLGKEFLGRKVDAALLDDLPDGVDPCGENGEFHTYVSDAPFFSAPVPVKQGEIVHRTYKSPDGSWDSSFYFLDLLPGD